MLNIFHANFSVAGKAVYLGVCIGPSVAGDSWDDPLKKWMARTTEIADSAAPLGICTRLYCECAISVTQYIAQLRGPPLEAGVLERRILSKLLHLPYNSVSLRSFAHLEKWIGYHVPSFVLLHR